MMHSLVEFTLVFSATAEIPQKLFGLFPFYFSSFSDFLQMASNGVSYAFYVWLAYALTYLLLIGLIIWSYFNHRQFKQQLEAKLAREQRVKQYQEQQT